MIYSSRIVRGADNKPRYDVLFGGRVDNTDRQARQYVENPILFLTEKGFEPTESEGVYRRGTIQVQFSTEPTQDDRWISLRGLEEAVVPLITEFGLKVQ